MNSANYKRVYTMTNENIACSSSLYNFENADVLTVLGSGDQYFTSLLNGAKSVTVFDINETTWLYFRIKFKAIRVLSYSEFISLFVYRRFDDINLFNKIMNNLTPSELNYYRYLIDKSHFNSSYNGCFYPNLMGNKMMDVNYYKQFIPYLDSDNYYCLKEMVLENKLPHFIKCNFKSQKPIIGHDILILSNIFDHLNMNAEEFIKLISSYDAKVVQANYSWWFNDKDSKLISLGLECTEVQGVNKDKNYVFSLRK